nr:glycosyltransferase family 2 protein [uncultured Pedobacter sp.]
MDSITNNNIAILSILYNSDELLNDYFRSLALQSDKNFTLFLLNNNPKNDTKVLIEKLKSVYPLKNEIVYLESSVNTGFAKGNNILIKLALEQGFKYILMSNNDLTFDNKSILSEMKSNCSITEIVTPKIYYYGSKEIWYNGGHIDYTTGLTPHDNLEISESSANQNGKYVKFAPACFVMFHCRALRKIGFFDEKYFVYYEDADLFQRANIIGYKIKLLPSISIEHKVSTLTGGGESLFSTYYFNRNRIYFVKKHFKGFSFIRSMTYILLTGFVKMLIYPFRRKKALLKGLIDGFKL